ncbi:hypothetical protein E3J51_02060 [Candidatus Bathyarchaeota archaeon]|nr:MAG: hypothetical protein E3J51_02060 [Candidatus Bathyarchaeota archaeon]
MKSVAAIGLFVVIMASVAIYSNNQPALADPVQPEEPKCMIFFDPPKTDVKVGETFTVTVLIDDVSNLWGYEIGLKFDRSVLEYVGAKSPYWKFVSGQTEYLFWVAGIKPQNGEVELMEFTFQGKSEGSSPLSFYVHKLATLKYHLAAEDYVGWPIPHKISEGFVTVT